MHKIPRIDFMIAYSCNLSCNGCISLSHIPRNGVEPLENIKSWAEEWSTKISPKVVVIFGGEPCLHPKLTDVCRTFREVWPDSVLRLITNGILLNNHDSTSWFDFQPLEIQISVHRTDLKRIINSNIKNILLHRSNWKVEQFRNTTGHKQMSWSIPGITIYKSLFGEFVEPYSIISPKKIKLHLSDPVAAHSICGAPDTPVLFKNKLYKCPAVANAMDISKEKLLDYTPLSSKDDLTEFVNHINFPEEVCKYCPDQFNATKYNHLDPNNVKIK